MINNVTLVGRLTKDPELKYTPSGVAVANMTLAVNRTYSNEQGERQADFINIVIWRKPAENAANYLKKGSLAGVTGRIETRSYDGQDGKRVYVTEVVADSVQFLEPRDATRTPSTYNDGSGLPKGYFENATVIDPFGGNNKTIDIDDSDLPF